MDKNLHGDDAKLVNSTLGLLLSNGVIYSHVKRFGCLLSNILPAIAGNRANRTQKKATFLEASLPRMELLKALKRNLQKLTNFTTILFTWFYDILK